MYVLKPHITKIPGGAQRGPNWVAAPHEQYEQKQTFFTPVPASVKQAYLHTVHTVHTYIPVLTCNLPYIHTGSNLPRAGSYHYLQYLRELQKQEREERREREREK